jgi:hypothetical protein
VAKNFKWGAESSNDAPIHVVLFVSRNKDNKDVKDFTERRYSFVTHQAADSEVLVNQFRAFADSGVTGEMSRMYYSVNARDASKVYKEFVKFLVDNPDFNLCSVQPKIAGIAAKKECAAEKKWFFDFDIDSEDEVGRFRDDILAIEQDSKKPIEVTVHRTPHGYAVETSRGFDVRPLYEKWDRGVANLKRDDLICYHWLRKQEKGWTGR